MTVGKHGLKALALALLAALALMTVAASGASASEFLVEEPGGKKTFAELNVLTETISGTLGENELLAGEIKINCISASVTGSIKKGGGVALAILFDGCSVLDVPNCVVYETEKYDKEKKFPGYYLIEGTGEIFLHASTHYIWLEGEPLGVVWFGDGQEECPLPLSETISGSFALKTPNVLSMLVTQALQTITAAEETSIGNLFPELGLYLGEEEADFKPGTTGLFYPTGAVKDKKWGAH